ncbi:MAG: selenocysteine-specific translation elongation factor [Desulfuromonadia bacterium]
MKQFILGTAGHIDHGKTSLVRALTGIDTDRLPEEIRRGITIELGFASLQIPGGVRLGIVDVPGHERFVRTMVAGVGGVDLVMLVIAADEGVMPQTREHLDICRLLGVQHGLVALTKRDMVDSEWLALVAEEVREFTAGTFLDGQPIVPVSSRTGEGLDLLMGELSRIVDLLSPRKVNGPFRLPIDRVFTMPGFGTIVTGTLMSGRITVGDEVEILPSGLRSRVRGVQVHGERVDAADAGSRVAINLQGVEHHQVARGETVAPVGVYRTTNRVDVRLDHLSSSPGALRHRGEYRFHAATYEVPSTLIIFQQDQLPPGEIAYAQLRFPTPVLLLNGDPFVLRRSSPAVTVAGGKVLDPFPPGRRRRPAEALSILESLNGEDDRGVLEGMVDGSRLSGIGHHELLIRSGIPAKRFEGTMEGLLRDGRVVQIIRDPKIYLSQGGVEELCSHLTEELRQFFRRNPFRDGMSREELKSRIPSRSDSRFFTPVITLLEKRGVIRVERDMVRLVGHVVGGGEDDDLTQRVLDAIERGGKEPPFLHDLVTLLNQPEEVIRERLILLANAGRVVRIRSDVFYPPAPLKELEELLVGHLREKGEVTLGEFRQISGLSRKFMFALLEYFDSCRLTIRVGDKRMLRRRG